MLAVSVPAHQVAFALAARAALETCQKVDDLPTALRWRLRGIRDPDTDADPSYATVGTAGVLAKGIERVDAIDIRNHDLEVVALGGDHGVAQGSAVLTHRAGGVAAGAS